MKRKLLATLLIVSLLVSMLTISVPGVVSAAAEHSDTAVPTSDEDNTGGFTTSPLWSKVDETTYNDTDYIVAVTNGGGHCTFGFTAFYIPSGATVSDVTVYYRARDASSGANNIRASVKVGGTYYDTTATSNNPITSFTTYSYAFTTNPDTGSSWTRDDVNGVGDNPLQAFGVAGTDFNPDIRVSMVYIEVNYLWNPIPTTTSISPTSANVSGDGFTLTVNGSNFVDDSSVRFNGSDRDTIFVSETQLTANITASDLTTAGTYPITVYNPTPGGGTSNSQTFTVLGTETMNLFPTFGPEGTLITVSGSGFSANTSGVVWFDTDDDSVKDAGESSANVTTDASGNITYVSDYLTAPAMTLSSYSVQADIPSGGDPEAMATFTKSNISTTVTINKYDASGSLIDTKSVTYNYMSSNMTVSGNGTTHYFMQGPSFDDSTYDALWNSNEDVNYLTRDYGAAMGTDVKDVCNLVDGGAAQGDIIQIKASDGLARNFDYEDVYDPEEEQGKMVLTWYTTDTYEGDGEGYVGDGEYYDGMRLVFFAETTNSAGHYVFGNTDMNNTLPASRWYFFNNEYPSTSGMAVKWVNRINIYQPKFYTCDETGTPQNTFTVGETVYVRGSSLSANTTYDLWIQPDQVLLNTLDAMDRPYAGSYTFSTGDDPSDEQENEPTNGSGVLDITPIWDTTGCSGDIGFWDVVADNQAAGTDGTYDSNDQLYNPGWWGFKLVAP